MRTGKYCFWLTATPIVALLSACSVGPKYTKPDAPIVTLASPQALAKGVR